MRHRRILSLNMSHLNRDIRDSNQERCNTGKDKRSVSREEALPLDKERKGTVQDREQEITMTEATGIEASLRQEKENRRRGTAFTSNKQMIGEVMQRFHAMKQRREEKRKNTGRSTLCKTQ